MLLTITAPEQFKRVPWKNGKGITTELAISKDGTLADFDWRISMASVTENGVFSDFTGYTRQLILVKGNGIDLSYGTHHETVSNHGAPIHHEKTIQRLQNILDIAVFDGGCETAGHLHQGPIVDFNVMVKTAKLSVATQRYVNHQKVTLAPAQQYFIYGLTGELLLIYQGQIITTLPGGHLLQITDVTDPQLQVVGEMMIIIKLSEK